MARLRGPGGCPWDHEQDHETLIPYLIEEAYEVIDAIKSKKPSDISEELGDLILQVVFHAQVASENKEFTIDDVVQGISEKLIRRHPHVFGDLEVKDADEVAKNWERIKGEEGKKKKQESILDAVPTSLPSLFEALKISKKAAKAGFEWKETIDVLDKVEEEIQELRVALQNNKEDEIQHEMGDLFFSLVNFCRRLNIHPEIAVKEVNQRFRDRFGYMEKKMVGKDLSIISLDEWETLWQEAKKETY